VRLIQFLQRYRLTPHPSTGCAPADLFLKRSPRSQWDMLYPTALANLKKKRLEMKEYFDRKTKDKELSVGLHVYVRDYHGKTKWVTGVIVKREGNVKWLIKVDGYTKPWARHSNQIRHAPIGNDVLTDVQLDIAGDFPNIANYNNEQMEDRENVDVELTADDVTPPPPVAPLALAPPEELRQPTRRSSRERRPPDRYEP
jgi:hypothetical protein